MSTAVVDRSATPVDAAPVAAGPELPAEPAGVLAAARERRRGADRLEVELLRLAVHWAGINSVDPDAVDACEHRGGGLLTDRSFPIAGEGSPAVSESAVAEFAAAVGLSTGAGRHLVGNAVELAFRLRRLWAQTCAGRVTAWRARQVAESTMWLTSEAADFVDRHVAAVAGRVGPAQLERLVDEAVCRFMPEQAEARRRAAADRRHVTVETEQVSFDGTVTMSAELDLADAHDLETAVATTADHLAQLGSTDSLDGRRATALGELGRTQLSMLFDDDPVGTEDPGPGQTSESRRQLTAPVARPGRRVRRRLTLYVHLAAEAITGHACTSCGAAPLDVARVESVRNTPVLAEQVRQWCGSPDARVTVRPVIDLADHVQVDRYEIPDRLREVVALRDHTCVFPWCTRPARSLEPDEHDADCDHIAPWHGPPGADHRAATCSCNLAPLCRRHHRLKTHAGWRYRPLEPGTYLWTSPWGLQYLRDHRGTRAVDVVPGAVDRPSGRAGPP